jgi:hypothetical protein
VEITPAYVDLVTLAHEYLTARQDALREEYRIGDWQRWDWNQDTRQLVFSSDGQPRVVADIQFVGSVSTVSDTWLWAWANATVDPALCDRMADVRSYGERHGIEQLITAKWEGDERDGWEMTSISAYLLGSVGAYRTPAENGFTYMVITSIRWVAPTH